MRSGINQLERRRRVVRFEVEKLLRQLRDGDSEAMAEAIAQNPTSGESLALRRDGRELIVKSRLTRPNAQNRVLYLFDVLETGELDVQGTEWKGPDVIEWLEEHREELDWIRHDLREQLDE